MSSVMDFISSINDILWGIVLLVLLCGAGIFYTFRLKFVQVRRFLPAVKRLLSSKSEGKQETREDLKVSGKMSSFQAFATAMAAQVGTGNLTGAASALVSGGPGSIFWIWVSAFFGMATIYAEAVLAQCYKQVKDNTVTGGPVYYIRAAFSGKSKNTGKILAIIFAVLTAVGLGGASNMLQSNSLSSSVSNAFGVPAIAVGIVMAVVGYIAFMGGAKRIAEINEKLVPIMAGIYILAALVVLAVNYQKILPTLGGIFTAAFSPRAVLGGLVGVSVKKAIRYGVARGVMSNEAGMGSTPHAHAVAVVKHPYQQGEVAMISVFLDTFVILTLTALVILIAGGGDLSNSGGGILLTQSAFSQVFGRFGDILIAVCLMFFAFSTTISLYFFGQANVLYLLGKRAIKWYALGVAVMVALGAVISLDAIWIILDLFIGLMTIPNILAVIALNKQVVEQNKLDVD